MPLTLKPTKLNDAFEINFGVFEDNRGSLATPFETDTLKHIGIEFKINQINWTKNTKKGTIRGLHYQLDQASQAKIVYCIKGSAWDVLVDLRKDSPTYLQWQGFEISDQNNLAVYIPKGFLHGFQTLKDDTDILYLMDSPYNPKASSGYRYDDPQFNLPWPLPVSTLSEQDANWGSF